MSFWTAIVVIVAIVALVIMRGQKYRATDGELPPPEVSRAELEREIAELRRRIAVLEQIATEDHRRRALSDEIEALREP